MAYKLLPKAPAPKKESMLSEAHRLPAQAASGAFSGLVGLPGTILSAGNEYIAKPITEAITGKKGVSYEDTPLGKILPTSQTIKESTQHVIPYLKPKNKLEEFANNVAEDAATMFVPGTGFAKVGLRGTSALKSLAVSLGANAGGDFVGALTGDDKKAAYTKMGIMFLLSGFTKPTANKEISNLYKQADQLLPQNATVNASHLRGDMNALKNKVMGQRVGGKKVLAPTEQFVFDEADKVLKQVQGNRASVQALKNSLRSLNENLQKAVYEAPDKGARTRAKNLAKDINRSINATLEDYGKTNPEWWKMHKSASGAFGAMAQSQFISRLIQDNVKGNIVTHGLLHALGVGTGAVGGIVPYQALKILYRMKQSPVLQKHYLRIVGSAAAENFPLMNKELHKLDKELQKENAKKKNKYKLVR